MRYRFAAIILTFAVGFVIFRDYRGLIVSAISCVVGIVIVCIPIFIYLYVNNALWDLPHADNTGQSHVPWRFR